MTAKTGIGTFLVRSTIFLIVLLAPVYLLSRFDNADKASSSNENIVKVACKDAYDSLDILFVGNSYTYSGIDPRLLDSLSIKVFNLGVATAGPYFYDILIDDYLSTVNLKPKVVFLLVSPMSFSSKGDNFVSYPIHRYLESPYSNESVIVKFGLFDMYADLITKSFKKGFDNVIHPEKRKAKNRCNGLNINRGFVPSSVVNSKDIIQQTEHLYQDLADDEFDESKAAHLMAVASKLREKEIGVVFYTLPTNLLTKYFNKSYLASYGRFVDNLGQNNQVIIAKLPPDDRYFRNIDHLNTFGAQLVTHQLMEEIEHLQTVRSN